MAGQTVAIIVDREEMAFDREIAPAATVADGDRVSFRASGDVLRRLAGGASLESVDLERANAVTRPVEVVGAKPGDALRIEIEGIDIDAAWIVAMEGFGPLGHVTQGVQVAEVPITDGQLELGGGLVAAVEPMIGCVGVAPAEGAASTMRPVYRTGGNLDLRELSPGAVLRLPVEVPGALLSIGDLHAAMGPGEPAFVAVEAAGTVRVRVGVEQGAGLTTPRIRTPSETICVGMGATYPDARADAVRQAFDVLTGDHGLRAKDAYAYTCARVGLRPAGPSGSMVDGLEAALAVVPDPR